MRRFRLRSIFLFVTLCAAALGYYINFSCVRAKCRFLILSGGEPIALGVLDDGTMNPWQTASRTELAQQTIDYLDHDDVLLELLSRQEIRQLPAIKNQRDPASWLRKRLRIHRSQAGVVSMDLVHYSFIDKDNVYDRPIILQALLRMIETEICSRYPQPSGISRCRIHQLELPELAL